MEKKDAVVYIALVIITKKRKIVLCLNTLCFVLHTNQNIKLILRGRKFMNAKIIDVFLHRDNPCVVIQYPNGDKYKYEIGYGYACELAQLSFKNVKKLWREINRIKKLAYNCIKLNAINSTHMHEKDKI